MTRPKHQQSVPVPKAKKASIGASQVDQLGEDSWIIVKKQKVTILIPPLPAAKQSMVHNTGESLLPTVGPTDTQPHQAEMHTEIHLVCEREEPKSLAPELAIIPTVAKVVPRSIFRLPRASRLSERSEGLESRPMCNFRSNTNIGVRSASKITKCSIITAYGGAMINKRIRTINLERKLQSAGGLRSWLVSRGLDHFVNIFQSKSISKYQLANLTMEKLKEMGSHAVGPRRKLMHAIDCLCHPCL